MSPADSASSPPARVLLVMPEQWPRALLRAALREVGYDALGAPGLAAALRYRTDAGDRGPVGLILLDQAAVADEKAATLLAPLLRRHGEPIPVLLARAMPAYPLIAAAAAVPCRTSSFSDGRLPFRLGTSAARLREAVGLLVVKLALAGMEAGQRPTRALENQG